MSRQDVRSSYAEESAIPCFDGEVQLEARFECPICLQCLQDPVLTSCGHRFCSKCITDWLRQKGNSCPIDTKPINQERDLFVDNYTRREIQELEGHSANCSHQGPGKEDNVKCTFHDVGCRDVIGKSKLTEHLRTNVQDHLMLLLESYKNLNNISREDVNGKAQEATYLWDPDSKEAAAQNEGPQWQSLARDLFGRIVLLEQRCLEQDIQIGNLKQKLDSQADMMLDFHKNHYDGILLWTIPNISQKLETMGNDPLHNFLYSPSFYTSPNGFNFGWTCSRFCARINLSPKDSSYLALIIHLMQSDHDICLDWPFMGRISIRLVNQCDPHNHLQETMMSRTELAAFQQPVTNMNHRGFGYSEFISLYDLKSQGFIRNDSIIIKIHVKSV